MPFLEALKLAISAILSHKLPMGARRRDIIIQFLIEAATLTGVGGVLGIVAGSGTALLIKMIMPT